LLALGLPMLAAWAVSSERSGLQWPLIAGAVGVAFLPLILVNGSRAGLLLGLIGVAAAAFFWRGEKSRGRMFRSKMLSGGAAIAGIAIVVVVLVFSRDEAFRRLAQTSMAEESRISYLPTVMRIAEDFWPVGAGFGSFDPLFRVYEPMELLAPQYLNHAHNDLLELVLVGGLPAILVLAAYLAWLGIAAVRILRRRDGGLPLRLARLGMVTTIILLLSSLVDYPLRTPLLAAVFAIASGWISGYLAAERADPLPSKGSKAFTEKHPVHRAAPTLGLEDAEDVAR